MVALWPALLVRLIDRQHEAVADAHRRFGIGAGEREIDADGDGLIGCMASMRVEHRDGGGANGCAKCRTPRDDVRQVPAPVCLP